MVIEAGLRGAFLLARGRPEGLMLIESAPEGVARSFWAAAICLPGFLALRFLAWADSGIADLGRGLVVELLGYTSTWAGFALLTLPLAESFRRRADWPHFIAAWNWANVVQYLVLLALTVPASLGLPPLLANGLGLAALGYALWLEWFVAKAALRIGGSAAAMVVTLDLALGIFVGGLVGRLVGQG